MSGAPGEPLVSVMVLAYQHAPYVRRALESVLAQRCPFAFEVVVGEDCSTDGTRELVAGIAAREPSRVRALLHPRNLGMHANVQATLAACRGRYVAFLEADDFWTDPDKLALQVAALQAAPGAGLCFHRSRVVGPDDEDVSPAFPGAHDGPFDLHGLLRRNFVPSASILVRRDAFPGLPSWYVEVGAGDWLWNILFARRGPLVFLPRVMSAYRVHAAGGWSRLDPRRRIRATLPLFRRLSRELEGADRAAARRTLWRLRAWAAAEALTGGRFERTYRALRGR